MKTNFTFRELQNGVATWAQKNFPDANIYHPLLGVSEEVGELCHAHLKMEQGIRTHENHQANKEDAVGDIVIYLADYCWRNGISLDNAVQMAWEEVSQRDWQKNKLDGVVSSEEVKCPANGCETVEVHGLACPRGGCEDVKAMETPVSEYDGKCSVCKTVELYKRNKSGLCPDCAADKRGGMISNV